MSRFIVRLLLGARPRKGTRTKKEKGGHMGHKQDGPCDLMPLDRWCFCKNMHVPITFNDPA